MGKKEVAMKLIVGTAAELSAAPVTDGVVRANTDDMSLSIDNSVFRMAAGGSVSGTTVVNVKDYGAKGDGATDDSAAINAALQAGKGQIVFMPKGTYGVKKTIFVPADTTLSGVGNSSNIVLLDGHALSGVTFRGAANGAFPIVVNETNAKRVIYRDFSVTGNKTAVKLQRQLGVSFVACEGGLCENVSVDHINYFPASAGTQTLAYNLATVDASNITIRGGVFDAGGYECVGIADGSRNITVDDIYAGFGWRTSFQIHRDCQNILVTNSRIVQSDTAAEAAITLHGVEAEPVSNVKFVNCTVVMTNAAAGANGVSVVDSGVNDINFINCLFNVNRNFATIFGKNILFTKCFAVAGAKGISAQAISNGVSVEGLRVENCDLNCAGNAITLGQALKDITIANNKLVSAGIVLAYATVSGMSNLRVLNNEITTTGTTYPISFDKVSFSGCEIRGNIIQSPANHAIWFDYRTGELTDMKLTIADNTVIIAATTGTLRGIYLYGYFDKSTISGNIVTAPSAGIRITGGCDHTLIINNDVRRSAANGIDVDATAGANNIVQNNFLRV